MKKIIDAGLFKVTLGIYRSGKNRDRNPVSLIQRRYIQMPVGDKKAKAESELG